MSRRESIGRQKSRQQSAGGDPAMKMVKVAVLPPRLPPGMAPPTGLGAADAFSWDEALNWQHNDPIKNEEEKKKSLRKKIGLTTERQRKNPETPPFVFREVPYETWRKHYAKDKDGNYHGTHAPAEDCLLKPDDVAKWRLGEAQTKGDQWTRGSEALPVYDEVRFDQKTPGYEEDYDYTQPPAHQPGESPMANGTSVSYDPAMNGAHRKTIADGKTAQEIIDEAKNKPKPDSKKKFKDMMSSGFRMAMLGN